MGSVLITVPASWSDFCLTSFTFRPLPCSSWRACSLSSPMTNGTVTSGLPVDTVMSTAWSGETICIACGSWAMTWPRATSCDASFETLPRLSPASASRFLACAWVIWMTDGTETVSGAEENSFGPTMAAATSSARMARPTRTSGHFLCLSSASGRPAPVPRIEVVASGLSPGRNDVASSTGTAGALIGCPAR